MAVVVIRPAHVNELRGLILNRLHYLRMTMAGGTDCNSGVAIEEDVAINVLHPNALAAFSDKFERGPGV